MVELLKIVRRGVRCVAYRGIGGGDGNGYLRCDLASGHPGPLHYDESDEIWWFSDAR
jgi:hypothetical protein